MNNLLIMLVDDNETDNFISKRMLELNGINGNFIIKKSGITAIEYFRDNVYSLPKIPDLLFLDINMPLVDGHAFLYKYDELPETVKEKCTIVVLTSSDSSKDIERFAKDENVTDYLIKPLSTEGIQKIQNALNHKIHISQSGNGR